MTRRTIVSPFVFVLLGMTASWGADGVPRADWFPKPPPRRASVGQVIHVDTVAELFQAAEQVEPGGTILLDDGHYMMSRYFELHTDDVTLRSRSGDRDGVILDGAESRHGELVGVTGCRGVTIADLTIQNIKWNGFKINADRGATHVTIYNCVIHNIWQRGVKGPAVRQEDLDRMRPTECRIQYCLFYNDRPKRFEDDPADTPDNFNGNYIGGIDVMYPQGWTISRNVFLGIRGRTGEARGAVFLWHDARDCVVERNAIIDCDSGICLGNSHRKPETPIHCTGCVVRNNFVVRCHENGILADYTQDCRIVHNSIHDPDSRLKRLIRLVHDNDGLVVANNLLSGPALRIETQSEMDIRGNVTGDFGRLFVDPASGNLHLRGPAPDLVGAAEHLPEAGDDFQGDPRNKRPCAGADEWFEP